MSKTTQTETEKPTEKQTGIVCPNCKHFVPDPPKTTLTAKVSYYLKGKDPKKGAHPIKITRYTNLPTVGEQVRFGNTWYKIISLDTKNHDNVTGFLEVVTKGKPEKDTKTRIQDPPEETA